MTNYSLKSCETLIDNYINKHGGECLILDEGVLGLGIILLHSAVGKKSIIIKEYYINPWCSGHRVRMYNKLPKKYELLINN
jgi:hypothetical protein